jgi:hypothetical protein
MSSKLTLVAVIAIVIAAVVVGLFIAGSPAEQRQLRMDSRRVTDLQRLSRAVERYYRDSEKLPQDLATILNGWTSSDIPKDPETEQDYAYEIISNRAYRLCADFALASREDEQPEFWSHLSGRQCFAFDYSDLVLD